jgi:hypothetical protein
MLSALLPQPIVNGLVLPIVFLITAATGWLVAKPLARLATSSRLERVMLYCLLGIVTLSWVGVILACLGIFRWWLLLIVLAGLIAWSQWTLRHIPRAIGSGEDLACPPRLATLALIILLAAAGWLYAKPAEVYLLTSDAAVYNMGGIVLARDGTLFHEPVGVYDYSAFLDPMLIGSDNPTSFYIDYITQFSYLNSSSPILSRLRDPFYRWSIYSNRLEIGFLSLPKVWGAFFVWLFGPSYVIWPVSFFGVAGLMLLYLLAWRSVGWASGLGAALLLGVSLPQLWFARFPVSEAHAQVLLLGGLYLALLARQHREHRGLGRRLAVWSALCLAALTAVRFEATALLGALVPFLIIAWPAHARWARGGALITWGVALQVGATLGTLLSAANTPTYYFTRVMAVLNVFPTQAALGALLILTVLAAGLAAKGRLRTVITWGMARSSALLAAAWLLWGVMALWLLMTRPWGQTLPGWLAQYWTRPGLALSLLGALSLTWRSDETERQAERFAFLGVSVVFLLLFSSNALVNPIHPWAMRRLVPAIMPALALCAAAAIVRGVSWVATQAHPWLDRAGLPVIGRIAEVICSIVLLLGLAFGIGQRTAPLVAHYEMQGMWSQLSSLAARFPVGSVLLLDDSSAGWWLSAPLETLFGLPSFVLQDTEALCNDSPVVDRLIRSALAQGRSVFFVVTGEGATWRSDQWQLVSQFGQRFDVPALQYSRGRPPNANDLIHLTYSVDAYRVLPPEKLQASMDRLQIPMGVGSYPYLTTGFYTVESTPEGEVFRWTQDEALIVLPWPAEDTADPANFCLKIELSGWRPEGEPTAHLVLKAEGIPLLEEDLDSQAWRTVLQISGRDIENLNRAELELSLQSNIWNAATFSGGGDQRDLGIVLYGLEIQPGQACGPEP